MKLDHKHFYKFYMRYARFGIFTVMKIHVVVFWVVMPCGDIIGYRRFGRPSCLHLQGGKVLRNDGILPLRYTAS